MRPLIASFFVLCFYQIAYSQSIIDPLVISSDKFTIKIEECQGGAFAELENDFSSQEQLKAIQLPIKTDSSFVLRQMVSYNAVESTELLILTGGFHYVEVLVINLTTNNENKYLTGRMVPYPENQLGNYKSQINKVAVPVEPENEYEIYIFYKNPSRESLSINVTFSDFPSWKNKIMDNKSVFLWLGFFFGALILLSLVNFVFYYLFHDHTYIVYVGYVLSIGIYEVLVFDIFDDTFVSYMPNFRFMISHVSLIFSAIFYILFLREFLYVKKNSASWFNILQYLIYYMFILMAVCTILVVSGKVLTSLYVRNIGMLVVLPIAVALLSRILKRKKIIDIIFVAGSCILIFSGVVSIISFLVDLRNNSDLYLQGGVLLELLIFNIGLGLRSRAIQNEKDNKLLSLIDQLKNSEDELRRLNTTLEDKVDERTKEVKKINLELTKQASVLVDQKKTIEHQLEELNHIRNNLEITVDQKTKELQQANKELVVQNAQLEQYTFITAHNLSAPIARLKGLTNIFELTHKDDQENEELIARIKQASIDMGEVVSDLNNILRIKNFHQVGRSWIDLEVIIGKILKRLQESIVLHRIKVEIDLEVKKVHSIGIYLESILYNLTYNGIKYSREEINSFVKIKSYELDNEIIIEVSDNGIGIDLQKHKNKLFGLYQRFHSHITGKGIGLFLVKTQVEALGGTIILESEINIGSMFRITIPN